MTIKKLKKLSALCLVSFGLVGWLRLPTAVRAANLGSLPLGSVIQIMGMDTGMCDDTRCTSTNAPVLPFRFVKMQGHKINTSGVDTLVGGNGNCNSGTCDGYSYWMLMDNYCWWESADCRNGYPDAGLQAGDRYIGQSFNGICPSSLDSSGCISDPNGTGYSNNISDTKTTYNVLRVLANFYHALPTNIGSKTKNDALARYDWDMIGVNDASNPPVAGWYTGTGTNNRAWPATPVYAARGVNFDFSGGNTVANPPIMTARIGLPSYTEWQGGLYHFGDFPVIPGGTPAFNPPNIGSLQPGSSSTFCKARFNAYNCNLNNNGVPGYPSPFASGVNFTYLDDDGNSVTLGQRSAANPRVHLSWFRTPSTGGQRAVWMIDSRTSTHSVRSPHSYINLGVAPTIWLASDIEIVGGEGTYDAPFCLSGGHCQKILDVTYTTGLAASGVNLSGTVNGTAVNQNVAVMAAVCSTDGKCVSKVTTVNTGAKNEVQNWTLTWTPSDLPAGTYSGTVWVQALSGGDWLTAEESGMISFAILPRNYDLVVMKNEPFNLALGDAASLEITPGTVGGVTVSIDSGNRAVIVNGTLAADSVLTFGNANLNFTVIEPATNQVTNLQFN